MRAATLALRIFVSDVQISFASLTGSIAKMAGETLCANINWAHDWVRTIVSHLPRPLTDQTAAVLPMERSDPLELMLRVVRKVQSSWPSS
jgi:hypothetical protein